MKNNKKSKKVIIILLNYNQKEHTLRCLESLYLMNYSDYSIVLVDNGSNDGTALAVKKYFPSVRVIEKSKNLGVAKGRNVGIRYADEKFSYKFLLILDNDTLVDAAFLAELINAIQSDVNVGIVFPKIYYMDEPNVVQYAGNMKINLCTGQFRIIAYKEKDKGQFNQFKYSMLAPGACMLIEKDVFKLIGKFDEKYSPYSFEDVDFSLRAGKKGIKILYVPNARICHKESLTASKGKYNEQYTRLKGKNFKLLMRSHASNLQLFCFYFTAPFYGLQTFVREYKRGNVKTAITLFKSFFSN